MSSMFLPVIGSAIIFVLYLILATMLLRKYKSTGNAGFLWLGLAVVIWPMIAHLVDAKAAVLWQHSASNHVGAPKAVNTTAVDTSNNLLVALSFLAQAIGVGLLMISVAALSKKAEESRSSQVVQGPSGLDYVPEEKSPLS